MSLLVLRAYLRLIYFDFFLARADFGALYRRVHRSPICGDVRSSQTPEKICHAVDIACIWYWKQVLCLQRSAVTACLLRKNGFAADLVIGIQNVPFRAHAWAELDGRIVNDKPYMHEIYVVLDRC